MSFRLRNLKYLLTWPRSEKVDNKTLLDFLKSIEDVDYVVVSEENHLDEGVHHHAVVVYKNALNSRRNLFIYDARENNDPLEEDFRYVANVQAIGNRNQDLARSISYVKKDGNYLEFGTEPANIKKMNNLEKIQYIKDHTLEECIYSGLFSLSQIRHIEYTKSKMMQKREHRERIVYWFWGPTGTGKTHEAWKIALENYTEDDICVLTGNNRDFKNGYTGQRCVIFDDFRNGDVKFNELLALCDKYPCNVNVKGSHVPWKADMILFTSPDQPSETFTTRDRYTGDVNPREDIGQFLRRLNESRYFGESYIP